MRRRSVLLAAGATAALSATATAPAGAVARDGRPDDRPAPRAPLVIGHRGAAGWRPEHTAASYTFAVQTGADWIEPDLVSTKDHQLVARHENEISGTTDVSRHPEFAGRRTTRTVDGRAVTGWFTEDFTLAELKTLRAVERLPLVRDRNTVHDGRQQILTFQEVVDLARRLSRGHGRTVSVFPETKHPTYFRSVGLPLEPVLADAVRRNRLGAHECVIQSFEPSSLLRIAGERVGVPLWQALGTSGGPYGHDLTYREMATPSGLRAIARYARWIGADKSSLVPPSTLLADAHAAGLRVGAHTFRAENQYLPADLRRGTDPHAFGDAFTEYARHYDRGVDAVVTDFPDLAATARDARPQG
ncbi:glycerophosphodiester phosphodiesterase family protein [Streptomyces sp. SP18CS02]|uniref:glycerophosphodiester phosphodiesterase family protein n=1 Tax=Streptomyces sp. SP18CS02 TaxID=3002531 RepID=UPI002E7A3B06|nr:glycerophosphodiester phosphodiesterase family protein [Streptomyces sp. SP18CS02]MEE1753635.1 glycerophosphodiester phosphodiesterase family protein [Streptomyces sp. SP18CS02]